MYIRLLAICLALLSWGSTRSGLQTSSQPQEQLQTAQQLSALGKHAEAEMILTKVVEQFPQSGAGWMQLGHARHFQGKLDSALEAHLKAAEFAQFKPVALYNVACVHALRKDTDKAVAALQQAVSAGFAERVTFATDPDLDSIRKDPRVAHILPFLTTVKDLFVEPAKILHAFTGEGANHEFGWAARRAGDVDGDKAIDVVITAPSFARGAGKIYVYSSRTGKLLFSRVGQPGQRLGNIAGAAGDVNADGVPDVFAGAPYGGAGTAELLSGKDGAVLHTLRGEQDKGNFGYKMCGLGDINGDGHADVAVTALNADGKQRDSGRCFGYSGKDGKLLFTLDGEAAGDKFGSAVASSENAKYPILAIGAQDAGLKKRGRVYVYRFAGSVPQPLFTIEPEESAFDLGQMFISFPGDLNADGVPDVYCSDFNDSSKGQRCGRIFVYSGSDGKKLLDIAGSHAGEGLGTSPSDAGDVNGDGVGDLIVGAWQNSEKARSAGKVYLYSGVNGKILSTWTCCQQDDTFGFDAVGLGDVNGDGRIDFLLSSAWSIARGPKTGRVFIVDGSTVPVR